jgi:ABC-type transport system substrate-binding protein
MDGPSPSRRRFHDGTPLNAEVVTANIERILKNSRFDSYGTFLQLEKAEVAGDMDVVFYL